jgi:hypothetical protein
MIAYILMLVKARRILARWCVTFKHDHIQTQAEGWQMWGGHQQDEGHLQSMIMYTLRIGKGEGNVSRRYLYNTIMYKLRVGEGEEDISGMRGTSGTWSCTPWGLVKVRRTSVGWQAPLQHNHVQAEGRWRWREHQRDEGHLCNMIMYILRLGEGEEDINGMTSTSTTQSCTSWR